MNLIRIGTAAKAGAIASSLVFLTGSFALNARASEPDWSEGAVIATPRANPFQLSDAEFTAARREGYLHALEYPVDISGVLIPWRPIKSFLDDPSPNPIRDILKRAFGTFTAIKSSDDLFARIGLNPYPRTAAEGADRIPHRGTEIPETRMGVTIFERQGAEAFTLSCAACHSANLFGKKILGMTNRFPRANDFFVLGKKAVRLVPTPLFTGVMETTGPEADLYARLRRRLHAVETKEPAVLGLDTSLSQVALSLARRGDDDYASFNRKRERFPRSEPLANFVADSKPAVWWNLKYKDRWLSDGSVVSGNPIYTNILWNEIGRGTDLHELETWLEENPKVITELTTAVFSTEAPRFTDFFPAERISFARAKRGEVLYQKTCAKCHGTYEKAWDLPGSDALPLADRLRTTVVKYPKKTRVVRIGTDLHRAQGMASLEKRLNPLAISRKNGIVIKTQSGYVPPPLVGIWARWPYFHNNSAPNLCAVLTAGKDRPRVYYAGEALDRERDYDEDCAGYPEGDRVPAAWKTDPAYRYDTSRPGMGNQGHDEGVFLKNGVELFSRDQKRDIIEFLKTL
jgi:mono/diheme cytochrome c family protein